MNQYNYKYMSNQQHWLKIHCVCIKKSVHLKECLFIPKYQSIYLCNSQGRMERLVYAALVNST